MLSRNLKVTEIFYEKELQKTKEIVFRNERKKEVNITLNLQLILR